MRPLNDQPPYRRSPRSQAELSQGPAFRGQPPGCGGRCGARAGRPGFGFCSGAPLPRLRINEAREAIIRVDGTHPKLERRHSMSAKTRLICKAIIDRLGNSYYANSYYMQHRYEKGHVAKIMRFQFLAGMFVVLAVRIRFGSVPKASGSCGQRFVSVLYL